jgi:diguanylate cyclase (GGDEF)-like protein
LFKQVNDTLGHEVGDRCIEFLGELLMSGLRQEDRAARLGGDEFVVLMPGQRVDEAERAAARLASLFAQMPWTHEQPPRPTLSIGLAEVWPGELDDPMELIHRADEALYAAKRGGRNRVRTYVAARDAA